MVEDKSGDEISKRRAANSIAGPVPQKFAVALKMLQVL